MTRREDRKGRSCEMALSAGLTGRVRQSPAVIGAGTPGGALQKRGNYGRERTSRRGLLHLRNFMDWIHEPASSAPRAECCSMTLGCRAACAEFSAHQRPQPGQGGAQQRKGAVMGLPRKGHQHGRDIGSPGPQLEDGYIRIANELFDAVLSFKFTYRQIKVFAGSASQNVWLWGKPGRHQRFADRENVRDAAPSRCINSR